MSISRKRNLSLPVLCTAVAFVAIGCDAATTGGRLLTDAGVGLGGHTTVYGSNNPTVGGTTGTTPNTSVGGATGPGPTGGAPSLGQGGTPSTGGVVFIPPATGGRVNATGGAPPATGGTPTSSGCSGVAMPTATGSLSVLSNGYVSSTYYEGFAYTWVGGKSISSTCITPNCGSGTCTPAFGSSALCAAGSLPGDTTYNSVVGFGLNLYQANSLGAPQQTISAPSSLTVSFTKSGTAQLRIQISNSTTSWCYDLSARTSPTTISISSFNTACWDPTTGTYLTAGTAIQSIDMVVPSGLSAVTFADCLTGLTFG